MSGLAIWSAARREWQNCPIDEITWLDRNLLSDGHDRSLHRSPRCPALRFVHHRWELFSRDPTHAVYVAPLTAGATSDYRDVRKAVKYVLPAAPAALEAQPVPLDGGAWLINVGRWILPLRIVAAVDGPDSPAIAEQDDLPATYDVRYEAGQQVRSLQPATDAVARVMYYFEHNPTALIAMAYYYQDFIRGAVAPHPVPIAEVAAVLDLGNSSAVSEYKKELQRRIWREQGHQRELSEFLLARGLIGYPELMRALRIAEENESAGRVKLARERFRYARRETDAR